MFSRFGTGFRLVTHSSVPPRPHRIDAVSLLCQLTLCAFCPYVRAKSSRASGPTARPRHLYRAFPPATLMECPFQLVPSPYTCGKTVYIRNTTVFSLAVFTDSPVPLKNLYIILDTLLTPQYRPHNVSQAVTPARFEPRRPSACALCI